LFRLPTFLRWWQTRRTWWFHSRYKMSYNVDRRSIFLDVHSRRNRAV
jgi:hypothetical protein